MQTLIKSLCLMTLVVTLFSTVACIPSEEEISDRIRDANAQDQNAEAQDDADQDGAMADDAEGAEAAGAADADEDAEEDARAQEGEPGTCMVFATYSICFFEDGQSQCYDLDGNTIACE